MPRLLPTFMALAVAVAGPAASAQPADEPTTLLERLNRETERLYRDVGRSLVRVQLPPQSASPQGAGEPSPLVKYKELDPKVRQELEQRRRLMIASRAAPAAPATTRTATDVRVDANAALIVIAPPAPAAPPDASFTPDGIGVILDDRGHVLVPQYVDREAAAAQPVRVSRAEGKVTEARFIGSDRQTNLTVLRLPEPLGAPVRLGDEAPREGSLVPLVGPADAAGRLSLWTGAGRDVALVFPVDGRCAGVARAGQFLSGRACRLIAEQIIRHGSVKRATLGVIITEIRPDDPLRRQSPLLADRSAVRIDQVMAGSPAEKAGLRPGDVLLALAGEAVHDIPSLAAAIAARSGPTELQVWRGGQAVQVSVDLQQK